MSVTEALGMRAPSELRTVTAMVRPTTPSLVTAGTRRVYAKRSATAATTILAMVFALDRLAGDFSGDSFIFEAGLAGANRRAEDRMDDARSHI